MREAEEEIGLHPSFVSLVGLSTPFQTGIVGSPTGTDANGRTPGGGGVTSFAFSAWHYVGDLGEPFELRSFVFRAVCGLLFSVIYAFRGFAPAVWTHTIYDVWVLVF